MTTFTQLTATFKNFLMSWLLVLGLKEGLVQCATMHVESEVILMEVAKLIWLPRCPKKVMSVLFQDSLTTIICSVLSTGLGRYFGKPVNWTPYTFLFCLTTVHIFQSLHFTLKHKIRFAAHSWIFNCRVKSSRKAFEIFTRSLFSNVFS